MKRSQIFSGFCIAVIITIHALRFVYQIGPRYEKPAISPVALEQIRAQHEGVDPVMNALKNQWARESQQAVEQILAEAEANRLKFGLVEPSK